MGATLYPAPVNPFRHYRSVSDPSLQADLLDTEETSPADRVLIIEDAADKGVQAAVRELAKQYPAIYFFLLSSDCASYAGAPFPKNVWLGARGYTNEVVNAALVALKAIPHEGHKWVSVTPRDAVTLPPDVVQWVFCSVGERPLLYPGLASHLKASARAHKVAFWFHSNNGYFQTFTGRAPQVEEEDCIVRLDGTIVGHIDEVKLRENGTVEDLVSRRIPSGKTVADRLTGRQKSLPKYKRNRKMGRELYMRHDEGFPTNTIEGRVYQDMPPCPK